MTIHSPNACTLLSPLFARDLYARLLLTRLVDECTLQMYEQGQIDVVASCRGHEAAQVGSAICIEVGTDFTLPYYRDLGVVLTLGMTPYEVFCTYLNMHQSTLSGVATRQLHWGYQKHNTITGTGPVATHILHAAGIAFAAKLRKAEVVTIAYCGDGATAEPDFLEGIRFAAQHQLPAVFICEQNCPLDGTATQSCIQEITLPIGFTHQRIDGTDVVAVYKAMRNAMQHTRTGQGPLLLEMYVTRTMSLSNKQQQASQHELIDAVSAGNDTDDALLRYQHFLEQQGIWDEAWAAQLTARLSQEVQQAMRNALHDTAQNNAKAKKLEKQRQ